MVEAIQVNIKSIFSYLTRVHLHERMFLVTKKSVSSGFGSYISKVLEEYLLTKWV